MEIFFLFFIEKSDGYDERKSVAIASEIAFLLPMGKQYSDDWIWGISVKVWYMYNIEGNFIIQACESYLSTKLTARKIFRLYVCACRSHRKGALSIKILLFAAHWSKCNIFAIFFWTKLQTACIIFTRSYKMQFIAHFIPSD